MIVLIDTNVVLTMFKRGHPCRPIYDAWLAGKLLWAVSTEVLLEYQEVLARMNFPGYAELVLRTIETVGEQQQSLLRISPTFHFHLITGDPDDDKFADCAIPAEADFIITDDGHFAPLINAGYKPQPITPTEFIERYL